MPERVYPLSYGQRGIWNDWKRHKTGSEYNMCLLLQFPEPIDAAALRRAFQALLDGHEALRTTYHDESGEALQRVPDRVEAPLEFVDASAWDDRRLDQEIAQRSYRAIDLERGPAFWGTFFSTAHGGDALLMVAHHIVADAWGCAFIVERLGALYARAVRLSPHEELVVEPEPVTYGSFALQQRAMLASEEGERLARFWLNELEPPLPAPLPPTDFPRSQPPRYDAATEFFTLDEPFVRRLNAFARGEGSSVYRVLLAAFFALLQQRYAQEDVIIATQLLGRSREYRDVLGYFVATGLIRERVVPALPFGELCKRIGTRIEHFREHEAFPLPALLERLGRDSAAPPIAPVLFTYQRSRRRAHGASAKTPSLVVGNASFTFGGIPAVSQPLPKRETACEFHAMFEEIDGVLHSRFTYRRDLWNAATIGAMAEEYRERLRAAQT